MSKKFLSVLIIALCFLGFTAAHNCIHHKIVEKFQPTVNEKFSNEEREHRLLEYNLERPIQIVIDSSNLVNVTDQQRELIVGKLVPVATEFLRKRLVVMTSGLPLKLYGKSCNMAAIPESHRTTGVDADLIIYVTAKNESTQNFLAWATACSLDSTTYRPNAGQINFNLHYLSYQEADFESQVDTTLHEMTHVLGFSSGLFAYYTKGFNVKDPIGYNNVIGYEILRGANRTVLKTPKVMETVKKYFGCSTAKGAEIENEGSAGSAGSHWERTIFNNEQLTASSTADASYSEFTLSLLQDSGWYKANFSLAEPMFFGKGAGCSFLENGCLGGNAPGRREWCSNETRACTFNYKYKGYCGADTFSDNCKYTMRYSNGDCENLKYAPSNNARGETYAKGSKCVISNVIDKRYKVPAPNTGCYNYRCENGTVKILLSGGGEILCTSKDQNVTAPIGNYSGSVLCPDPASFCADYYPGCPNSCSSKGYCVKGVCECRAGYGGDDCSVAI